MITKKEIRQAIIDEDNRALAEGVQLRRHELYEDIHNAKKTLKTLLLIQSIQIRMNNSIRVGREAK